MEASQKNKTKQNNEPPYEPEIPLLDRYPPQTKNINAKRHMHPNVHRSMYTIVDIRKQPMYLSTDEWKRRGIHIHIHIMEYYSALKRVKFCHLQQHG